MRNYPGNADLLSLPMPPYGRCFVLNLHEIEEGKEKSASSQLWIFSPFSVLSYLITCFVILPFLIIITFIFE